MVSQAADHRLSAAGVDARASCTARLSGDFAQRAVQLARASHLDGTARLERMRPRTLEFIVPSRGREREYQVIADHAGTAWCACLAANHNKPCSHAGAVYHALRQLAKACREYAEYAGGSQ